MGQPTKRNEIGNLVTSWIWALAPMYTLGLGNPAIQLWAAVQKRSIWQALTVPIYLAGLVMFFIGHDQSPTADNLATVGLALNWLIGTVHAVALRPSVYRTGRHAPARRTLQDRQAAALAAHDERAKAREAARSLAVESPETALELQIGRADIPRRSFPDGGLVDVNGVDAAAMVEHLGFTQDQAETVVRVREEVQGFASAADLGVLADLDPTVTDAAAELMIFLPYRVRG